MMLRFTVVDFGWRERNLAGRQRAEFNLAAGLLLVTGCRLSVKRSGDTSAARPLIVVSVFLNKTKRDYVTQ